jgi:glycosyltransferase involved in cell wall biosynthesis
MKCPSVTVVTPTISKPEVFKAIESVRLQTYPNVKHLVIFDGQENYSPNVADHLATDDLVILLPENVGFDKFNGHRSYAAASYLVNTDYIAFLDEDNWFDQDHIESMVEAATRGFQSSYGWSFSRRKIVSKDGEFICNDECESLGDVENVFYRSGNHDYLIDASCFLLPIHLAVSVSPLWYRKARAPGVVPADRSITQFLLKNYPDCAWNRKYSLNYRVGSRDDSVKAEFFLEGNKRMQNKD